MTDTNHALSSNKNGVLQYQGKKYAVGLLWLTTDDDAPRGLAQKRAKRLGADFLAERSTIVVQQGYGSLAQGHRLSMAAAASLVADTIVGEWHGVFEAENGWWYMAVHGDAIAPDGDILFEREEDALAYFNEQNEAYRWPRVLAPEVWEIPESAGEVGLDMVLEDISGAKLKPVNMDAVFGGPQKKFAAGLVGLILGALILAVFVAPKLFATLVPDTRPANFSYLDFQTPDIIAAPPPEKTGEPKQRNLDPNKVRLPRAGNIIRDCIQSINQIMHPFSGWTPQSANCTGADASVFWERSGGSIETLRRNIDSFPDTARARFSGTNSFTASISLPEASRSKVPTPLLERDSMILVLNRRFSDLGRLELRYVKPEPPQPSQQQRGRSRNQTKPEDLPPPDPNYIDFKLQSETPPYLIADLFNLPGLVLKKIEWRISSKSWLYETQIILHDQRRADYAKRVSESDKR